MNETSLAPHHRSMLLEGSGISPEVVEARGYGTVETKAQLEAMGFSRAQRNVPGLLIPIYSPGGEVATWQLCGPTSPGKRTVNP